MFGSAGGLMEFRAALLATRGFVAYALPFFSYEDLPKTMYELDLDYFEVIIFKLSMLSLKSCHIVLVLLLSFVGLFIFIPPP